MHPTPYFCQGVVTDRSIIGLNVLRVQTPARTSVTSHKQGLNFSPLPMCARVDLFRGKRSLKRSVKMPCHSLIQDLHAPVDGILVQLQYRAGRKSSGSALL